LGLDDGQRFNDFFQAGALLAERLGTFRIVPDSRIFEFATDFDQLFTLGIVVKDTPSGPASALADP